MRESARPADCLAVARVAGQRGAAQAAAVPVVSPRGSPEEAGTFRPRDVCTACAPGVAPHLSAGRATCAVDAPGDDGQFWATGFAFSSKQ